MIIRDFYKKELGKVISRCILIDLDETDFLDFQSDCIAKKTFEEIKEISKDEEEILIFYAIEENPLHDYYLQSDNSNYKVSIEYDDKDKVTYVYIVKKNQRPSK